MKEKICAVFPPYAWLPLFAVLAFNSVVYNGTRIFNAGRIHYSMWTAVDDAIPFFTPFVVIYVLAFVQWGIGYILIGRESREACFRFYTADIFAKIIALVFFLAVPTMIVRPEVTGNSVFDMLTRFIFRVDAADNLFPSIHCYVSWLSFRGVKEVKSLPRWFSPASCVMAILIIISTQVLKQHYIVDAIAAVLLVEIFWRFYRTGNRHMGVYRFFEKINSFVWKGKQDL